MWQDIYLEVDNDGYIKTHNINLIKGNIRLKLKDNYKNIKIGGWFLSSCGELEELDLGGLQNVTKIEGCFLPGCKGLELIDVKVK